LLEVKRHPKVPRQFSTPRRFHRDRFGLDEL